MRWTVGLEPSTVGHIRDVPGLPGTLGWDGQWHWSHLEWDTQDMSGLPGTLGLEPSTVEHVQDVPWLSGTLGWDGHWD